MRSRESERLKDLQQCLLSTLTCGSAMDERSAEACFREPPRGRIADRWHIYAAGYLTRLGEALENDYPALRRIVGRHPFDALVRRYARSHPPRSHDLGLAGDRLPRFLEADGLSRKLPFLPDLARLEWALAQAFVSEDARPLRWDDLQAMDAESVSEMHWRLMPGTTVLRSEWPLIELWECKDRSDREISVAVEGRPSIVLVFRRSYQAHCAPVDHAFARFVEAAADGATLAGLREALAPDGDPAATREFLQDFRRMIGEGLVVNPTRRASFASKRGEME